MVTQAAAGQQPVSQPSQKVTERREAPAPQLAAAPPNTTHRQEVEPSSVPAHSVTQPSHPETNLPSGQKSSLPEQPQVPNAETSQLQGTQFPEPQVSLEENEPSSQPEPVNLSVNTSPRSQLLDFQIGTEEALTQTAQLKTSDIDDILKKVIEEEREKAERSRNLSSAKADNQSEDVLGVICKEYSLLKQMCCRCVLWNEQFHILGNILICFLAENWYLLNMLPEPAVG